MHPKKLLNSKWTACQPINKEKHFVVAKMSFDLDTNEVIECLIEAVMSKRSFAIDWRELNDDKKWLQGWK